MLLPMHKFVFTALVLLTCAAGRAQEESVNALHIDDDVAAMMTSAGIVPPLVYEGGALASQSRSGHGPFGLGIQVGSPTALTGKYFLGDNQAIAFGVGGATGYRSFAVGLFIYGDYLFHFALASAEAFGLSAYVGPGLWVSLFSPGYIVGYGPTYYPGFGLFSLGARVPLGLAMMFSAVPIELFLELDPSLLIFPGVDFGIGASLGFRFYF